MSEVYLYRDQHGHITTGYGIEYNNEDIMYREMGLKKYILIDIQTFGPFMLFRWALDSAEFEYSVIRENKDTFDVHSAEENKSPRQQFFNEDGMIKHMTAEGWIRTGTFASKAGEMIRHVWRR